MYECKETKKKTLSINRRTIAKLCGEAARAGKDPAFIMSVYGLDEPLPKEWVAIPLEAFKVILSQLEKD